MDDRVPVYLPLACSTQPTGQHLPFYAIVTPAIPGPPRACRSMLLDQTSIRLPPVSSLTFVGLRFLFIGPP